MNVISFTLIRKTNPFLRQFWRKWQKLYSVSVDTLSYIYKDECLFVWMSGTYTNSHFWTDLNQTLHTSPPLSGGGRRVYMDPKFLTFSTFWALFLWGPQQNHGHEMAAGANAFRDILISVVPVGVRVTSPTLRRRWWRIHPRQPYVRGSSGSSSNVTEITS